MSVLHGLLPRGTYARGEGLTAAEGPNISRSKHFYTKSHSDYLQSVQDHSWSKYIWDHRVQLLQRSLSQLISGASDL